MRAAVCYEFGAPLAIEEVELAPPAESEVEVRLAACAICHSDISYMDGDWDCRLPAVFGHEAAGVVANVGAGVAGVAPGDHVVVTLVRHCGTCFFCTRGKPALCEATFRLDEEGPLSGADGRSIHQGLRTGAFAEAVTVHSSQVVPLPPEIPLDRACLLACGVASGVGAVVNDACVQAGESVVVVGAGGVGLNSVQGAALAGARPIVAVDLSDAKLRAAQTFGATHGIDPAGTDARSAVRALTEGRGADHVIVAVGAKAAIEQGLSLARRGGTVVVVGMTPAGVTAEFDPGELAGDAIRIVGSKIGSIRPSVDLPRFVDLYREGRLELDALITGRYPLQEINEAIASVRRGDALRNVIVY